MAPRTAPSSLAWTGSATSCQVPNVKGENPLKDLRVHQATLPAIDSDTLNPRDHAGFE